MDKWHLSMAMCMIHGGPCQRSLHWSGSHGKRRSTSLCWGSGGSAPARSRDSLGGGQNGEAQSWRLLQVKTNSHKNWHQYFMAVTTRSFTIIHMWINSVWGPLKHVLRLCWYLSFKWARLAVSVCGGSRGGTIRSCPTPSRRIKKLELTAVSVSAVGEEEGT